MEDFNVQKLISIFLGLAIIISSITLILSGFINFTNSNQNEFSNEYSIQTNQVNNNKSNLNQSAFVDSPKDLPNYYGLITQGEEFTPSGNLTDDFASYSALQIVKTNEDGPQIDENGNQNIKIPDIEKVSENFVNNFVDKKIFNNDELEKKIEADYLKIKITNNSTDSINSYLNNFNNLYTKYLTEKNINNLLDNNNYTASIEALSQLNNDFYKESLTLQVPENFLNFHKKFIKILAYQKESITQSQKINNDPLYTYYFLEKTDLEISNSINEFQKEAQKLSKQYLFNNFSQNKNPILISLFEKIILPQEAHAFLGFGDIVFDPAAVSELIRKNWQDIKRWLKTLATEILKDQLIHRMINNIVRWVQGGGKPQFITNWQGFFADSVSRGAKQAVNQIMPRVCQSFKPLLQVALQEKNIYNNIQESESNSVEITNIYDEYNSANCTLGSFVNNLKGFYNNFEYGGWNAYANALKPQNNFFGAFIIAKDLITQKGLSQKEIDRNDAVSSKGFLSKKVCVKQKVINTIEKEKSNSISLSPGEELKCGPINKDGFAVAEGACAIVKCEEYENRTPGALIGDTIGNSITAGPIGRIVNAQDVTALVSALMNSALNKLINAGPKGLLGVFAEGIKSELLPGAISDPEDACYGTVPGTEEYNNCKGITNNNIYKTNNSSEQTNILQQARTILDQINSAIETDNNWLQKANGIQTTLKTVEGLCSNLINQINNLNNNIESQKPLIQNELLSLSESKTQISNIIAELDSSNLDIQRLNEISNKINKYNDTSLNKPQERFKKLLELESVLEQIIVQRNCSISLPSL